MQTSPAGERAGGPPPSPAAVVRGFSLRLFSHELAVLLGAGIPLLEAVQTLGEKEHNPAVAGLLSRIAQGLSGGVTLSTALQREPRSIDALFVSVVQSAERTGQLRQALTAHAAYLAWTQDLRGKLLAACIYPAMLLGAGLLVLLFLLLFVIPRFAEVLESLGGQLPVASAWLMQLGRLAGEHRLFTLVLVLMVSVLPWQLWRRSDVRERAEQGLWRLPLVGDKLRLLALARLYRTLSMLLQAGVPLPAAMRTAHGVTAVALQPALQQALAQVTGGMRLSQAIEGNGLTTPVSLRMVRVGERTGQLGPMLAQAAAFYDEELSRLSELVARLVNPVLMLCMGGLIGTVVVLMYLPIFQLAEQTQ
jgi:general secretion pathway protein F